MCELVDQYCGGVGWSERLEDRDAARLRVAVGAAEIRQPRDHHTCVGDRLFKRCEMDARIAGRVMCEARQWVAIRLRNILSRDSGSVGFGAQSTVLRPRQPTAERDLGRPPPRDEIVVMAGGFPWVHSSTRVCSQWNMAIERHSLLSVCGFERRVLPTSDDLAAIEAVPVCEPELYTNCTAAELPSARIRPAGIRVLQPLVRSGTGAVTPNVPGTDGKGTVL
jgi:hypothetical protein